MAVFVENFRNHVKGESLKILEFTLVIIFVIYPKNDNLGLNENFCEFSLYMDFDNIFRITSQVEISPRIFC